MPFDPGFLKTLESLNVMARRLLTQEERGEREGLRRGASVEFADYRHYVSGDELRYIDWNVYARHGELFVKEFSAEESVHLLLLLDASPSMAFGTPTKFQAARELAAALAYIALSNFDTAGLYTFADEVREVERALRGKRALWTLLDAIERIRPAGRTDMAKAFQAPLPRLKGRALAFVLTDFYDLDGYGPGLRALQAQRLQIVALHLVAREEVEPPARGRVELVDLETGQARDTLLTPDAVDAYLARLRRHGDEVERFCLSREIAYVRLRADAPIQAKIAEILRRGGIVEHR
jgi:uncharacterized protein (DUF58 family)